MTGPRRVVVTGIGLLTPLGVGVPAVWPRLVAGESGIGEITTFDASRLPVQIAGQVDDFDPADFLPRKDVIRLDRVLHLALAAADLALADAAGTGGAFAAGGDRSGVATVVGSAIGGAKSIADGVRTEMDRPHQVSPFFVPNAIANMAAAMIALRHGFGGPSTAPATACAASADAVGHGYRLVRDGYASACLVGGAEACVVSPIVAGFANMRALSRRNDAPAHASRPFDADRDGFVLAEGAAMLLLEPAEAATARGARVYAEICGYGQATDAYHMTAPDPSGAGAARAMSAALREAGLGAGDVRYVNAHGTGTRLSDAAETRAIKLALGEHAHRVPVGSTKSMTGHLLGAAGALETAICALVLDRGVLPPTINLTRPDPDCDLDYLPLVARRTRPRVAMSNSFAFGGHNVSLVLRRAERSPRWN